MYELLSRLHNYIYHLQNLLPDKLSIQQLIIINHIPMVLELVIKHHLVTFFVLI